MQSVIYKKKISLGLQALSALLATVAAVALPQLFHTVGILSGSGTVPGEIFLPMHLPVILVGLLAGPVAGGAAGLLAPVISFALTAMPRASLLPFMVLELLAYGVFAGLLRSVKLPSPLKVVAVQVAGRAIRAVAILLAVYAFGNTGVQTAVIWKSIATGLPGLILQWTLIPLTVFWVENRSANE